MESINRLYILGAAVMVALVSAIVIYYIRTAAKAAASTSRAIISPSIPARYYTCGLGAAQNILMSPDDASSICAVPAVHFAYPGNIYEYAGLTPPLNTLFCDGATYTLVNGIVTSVDPPTTIIPEQAANLSALASVMPVLSAGRGFGKNDAFSNGTGTLTVPTYQPNPWNIQIGQYSAVQQSNTVVFPRAFENVPVVSATLVCSDVRYMWTMQILTVTPTKFTYSIYLTQTANAPSSLTDLHIAMGAGVAHTVHWTAKISNPSIIYSIIRY